MALITIQVIEGHERGHVFDSVPTPLTIGREDDNRIRLNDERVSRFHAKIQEDGGRVILTDLDSTNGTRVNGQPVQMRVLQLGDQLSIGRCILLYGSLEQMSANLASREEASSSGGPRGDADGTYFAAEPAPSHEREDDGFTPKSPHGTALFPRGIPAMPEGLRLAQQAQFSDLVAYVHDQLQNVIQASCELPASNGEDAETPDAGRRGEGMFLSWLGWQRLLVLEAGLAKALRRIADPTA